VPRIAETSKERREHTKRETENDGKVEGDSVHFQHTYEGHLESKERSRIQPAQLFQCS
jgi:hypothetical protein